MSEGTADSVRFPFTECPKVLVYQGGHPERFAEVLQEMGVGNVVCAKDDDTVRPHLEDTEIVFGWNFPGKHFESMPRLRWIQWSGAGVDAALVGSHPFPATVQLTRITHQFSRPIAEYIFAYLLYVVKDIPRMTEAKRNHKWDPFRQPLLSGRTMGVAGLGSIGQEVVKKARAFDMRVTGLSLTGKNADCVDEHFGPSEWKSFVKDLDVLVLTLPLTDETQYCVDAEVLSGMKEDAILVNIGRGKLIREADLTPALLRGRPKAAILDVFEQEPLPESHAFWEMDNVYVSPHMSGPSERRLTCEFFVNNLIHYVKGETLEGLVDLSRKY